jgi:hypothetical protein
MPAHDRKRPADKDSTPSADLVLAAIARACRHAPRATPGVRVRAILEHLAVAERSAGARAVRALLTGLEARGQLRRSRRRGRELWALSPAARRRLAAARGAGVEAPLPESPQHLAWRNARATAAMEIERLRLRLEASLGEAQALLAAEPPPASDAWLELAVELWRDARAVGSATHCLYEWAEPAEDRRDLDMRVEPDDARLDAARRARLRALRAGRRNVGLWR